VKLRIASLIGAIALVVTIVRPASADLSTASVKLTLITSRLHQPIAIAVRTGDPRLFIAEKVGTVRAWNGTSLSRPLLNISKLVSKGTEQGLLGLAFNPAGKKLYVYFTAKNGRGAAGDDVLREYRFSNGHAVARTARDLFRLADPYPNHNGGNVVFGQDGYLYVGIGDGGSSGDPQDRAQNLKSLFGKMLRIDPKPAGKRNFTIPPSNPFVGKPANDAIWAYGLRNPWRWSFDRLNGDLWIGDVGQNTWEEVDHQLSTSAGGENYGWNLTEGNHPYNGGTPPSNWVPPVFEYRHLNNNCAIIGGYVYRGSAIAALAGAYLYADLCVGNLRAFMPSDPTTTVRDLGSHVDTPTSFGEDQNGELYVMTLGGRLFRIDQGP